MIPTCIVIGDLNAYAKEDPITVFRNAGYVDTIDEHLEGEGYSFVFNGPVGLPRSRAGEPDRSPRR